MNAKPELKKIAAPKPSSQSKKGSKRIAPKKMRNGNPSETEWVSPPFDQATVFLPIYTQAQGILRSITNEGKSKSPTQFKLLLSPKKHAPLFLLQQIGDRRLSTPTIELGRNIALLMKRKDKENSNGAINLADAILFFALIQNLPDDLSKSSHFDALNIQALAALNSALGKQSLQLAKLASASPDANPENEAIAIFRAAMGVIRRIGESRSLGNQSSFGHPARAIETARLLCEETGELPSKSEIKKRMEDQGWKLGKSSNPRKQWEDILTDAGLGDLPP